MSALSYPVRLFSISLACALLCAGCASSRARESAAASRYSHRMHNRFYETWSPPKSIPAARGKISVPVDVQIDRAGNVRRFSIAKPSGIQVIDDSIRQVARRLARVAPPPLVGAQDQFDLRIFFELDVRP